MDMKHQEQVLYRDLGMPPDLLQSIYGYSNVGPSDSRYVGYGDYNLAYPLYFKYMGERSSLLTPTLPNYLGYQVFDSTTNPAPKFNYCRNSKLRLVCHPVGHWSWYRTFPNYETCSGSPFRRYGIQSGTTIPVRPESIDWSESLLASNRAWWAMQPRFQGDFDGLNFLFELKDFKNIAKSIIALRPAEITQTLKRVKRTIREADAAVRNGSTSSRAVNTANSITRLASEAVLIKHFAIDPTVKDLLSLHSQLQELVADVQHRFRDKGNTLNSRHYSEKISEYDATELLNTTTSSWLKKGVRIEDNFTATMEYTYGYKLRGHMDALKRYYGMEFNAGVAWNAIPFSFLIDYFIKVGDAIENMATDPNVALQLHQYCESRHVSVKHGMMFNGSCATKYNWVTIINGGPARDNQLITGYEGTLYERRVVPPRKGVALPRVKLPSTKQALNMLALVRCMW